jgi:hypothetical protein
VIENNILMRFVQSKDIVHETHGTMVEINLASQENAMKLMHVYISSFAKKEALLPNKKKGRVTTRRRCVSGDVGDRVEHGRREMVRSIEDIVFFVD